LINKFQQRVHYMTLTIQNINKIYKRDIREWRIGKIETLNAVYLITLYQPNGNRLQINLERISNIYKSKMWEVWHWDENGKPNSVYVESTGLSTPGDFLTILHRLLTQTQ